MNAIVLIGGFGTRLRPITWHLPKQLIPIAGKPMLYHVLDILPPEVDEAIFATGYLHEAIAEHVRLDPPKIRVRCVPEATPLGTGGGMRNAGDGASDPFLLLNSDVIAQIDVAGLLALHRRRAGVGAMTLAEVEDTRPYGVAALGTDDRVNRFVEKPAPEDAPSHWINAGVQVWNREVLERIPRGRPVSFETEIVPGLLPMGIYGFRSGGFWEDAGTPQRLLNAQRLLFEAGRGAGNEPLARATVHGPIAALDGVEAVGAEVGPFVHLGRGVILGRGTRVRNSVLMDGTIVGPDSEIADSILGPRSRVSGGTKLAGAVVGEPAPASAA